jgi:hypothetical protein
MVSLFALLCMMADVGAATTGPRVAIVAVDGDEVNLGTCDQVRVELSTTAAAMNMIVMDRQRVQVLLSEAIASGLRCQLSDATCAARTAIALEVDAVLSVRLTSLPDGLWLWAQLTRSSGITRRASVLLDGPQAVPLTMVWEQLTTLNQEPLLMPVLVYADHGEVDGQATAVPPLSTWLPVGTHVVTVGDATALVVVSGHGRRDQLWVLSPTISPQTDQVSMGPLFVVATGVGMAVGGATGLTVLTVPAWTGGQVDVPWVAAAAGATAAGSVTAMAGLMWWLSTD